MFLSISPFLRFQPPVIGAQGGGTCDLTDMLPSREKSSCLENEGTLQIATCEKPQLHFCSSISSIGIWKHGINSASQLRKRRGNGGISDLVVHQRFWYLSFRSEDRGGLMLGTSPSEELVNMAQLCFHQISKENCVPAFSLLPGTMVEKSINKDFSVWLFSDMLTSLSSLSAGRENKVS